MSEYRDRVFNGSCENMAEIPDGVIDTCVTSPPYFGLREYDHPGQLGHEPTPEAFIERLVGVFREVKRVLRDDGTLWVNMGDSYAANRTYQVAQSMQGPYEIGERHKSGPTKVPPGMKPKDLIGIPWMLAFALRADGWYLRSDIIWAKPNYMPSSVRDRCTSSHEYIFMLSKSRKYYYDQDAIREPLAESSIARLAQDVENQAGSERANGGAKANGTMKAVRFDGNKAEGSGINTHSGNAWSNTSGGANKRDVWTVAPGGYSGAHFATYPPRLIMPCILAGSRPGGIVLDPFMGSGTTAYTALQLGRSFTGYELNPAYCDLIRARLGLFGDGVA